MRLYRREENLTTQAETKLFIWSGQKINIFEHFTPFPGKQNPHRQTDSLNENDQIDTAALDEKVILLLVISVTIRYRQSPCYQTEVL